MRERIGNRRESLKTQCSTMRDLCEYSKIKELMEEYNPKPAKMAAIRQSIRYKPMKEGHLPKSRSQKELVKQLYDDIYRQAASESLKVNMSWLEIHRNELTKKVKLLDVKLSFSYQENYCTQTIRMEKNLVRHGNKWVWMNTDGTKNVITFPYLPGDRVNLNVGIFIHKTTKHGIFGKETITQQVGTAADCIVLARNNGVGMGLPLGTEISHNIRLNFDINGRGHKLTVKLRLDMKEDIKGPPMMWLRPKTGDKRFRSQKESLDLLLEMPPNDRNEDARVKLFVYNYQRLVNYHKEPVLDCRSIRPTTCETEIPTGIEIKQSATGQLLAYLVPVVKPIDKESNRYRLAILVVTVEGPYCLCSLKWKSADKFDYKIFMYKTQECFGQRIKWATKDFLDISYAVLNSTGHQVILRQDSDSPVEDICIGVSLKFLVRWANEPLPWKESGTGPMLDCLKYLNAKYCSSDKKIISFSGRDMKAHIESLPQFFESEELVLFSDMEEFILEDRNAERVDGHISVQRTASSSASSEIDAERRAEVNIEDPDDEEDEIDSTTHSSRPKYDIDWDDITSGFTRSEHTGGGSWIDSVY